LLEGSTGAQIESPILKLLEQVKPLNSLLFDRLFSTLKGLHRFGAEIPAPLNAIDKSYQGSSSPMVSLAMSVL